MGGDLFCERNPLWDMVILKDGLEILERFKWFDLDDVRSFDDWRDAKLSAVQSVLKQQPVEIEDLSKPTGAEMSAIALRCDVANFAVYKCAAADSNSTRFDLRQFAAAFGLQIAEKHRSAEKDGIVLLQPSDAASKRGYIPYSTRAMNWHTDGYYNDADNRISGMLLHCVQPAQAGGLNQFLDPEIVYLRLRQKNPELVRVLMRDSAMTIPANTEADGSVRPASVGPVFYGDRTSGRLQMRYTARTRSIEWRDDPLTREAETSLRQIMSAPDPLTLGAKLEAGQGMLCNNVLHNRTGFSDETGANSSRLVYRVRFHNRIERNSTWPN